MCTLAISLASQWAVPTFGQIPEIKQEDRLDKDLDTINDLLRMGDFERVLGYLDHMKAVYGDSPKLTFMYKKVYIEAKMFSQLEDLIRNQLAAAPRDEMLIAELGNVKFLQNDTKSADSLWEMALNSGGANTSVYVYVANSRLQFGDYDGAVAAYRRGRLAIGSQSVFAFELANVFESQRKYVEAVNELMSYLNQTPAKLNLVASKIGGFLKDTDDTDEIVDAVIKAARMYPDRIGIQEILGEIYLKLGRMDRAFDTYRKLGKAQMDDGASICSFAARCFDNQAYATAIEAVDEYLNITKRGIYKEKALMVKGQAQRKAGMIDGAIGTLTSLADSAKHSDIKDQAAFLLGTIYSSDLDDCPAAMKVWDDLAEHGGIIELRDKAVVEMASCYMRMDNFPMAESTLTALKDENKGDRAVNQKALFLLGDLAFMSGNYSGAKEMYELMVRIDPGDEFSNNALERLTILSAAGPDSAGNEGLKLIGDGLRELAMGELVPAAELFLDSVFTGTPLAQIAGFYSAAIYEKSGDNPRAIELFQKFIADYPSGSFTDRAYLALGDLYMLNKEDFQLARSAFETILKEFPDGPVVEQAREKLRRLDSIDKIG